MSYRIVEGTRWTWRGRVPTRWLEGEPSWQALRAWRDEGDVGAPNVVWLRDCIMDALNEIERLQK
jgi:hypothetical protein